MRKWVIVELDVSGLGIVLRLRADEDHPYTVTLYKDILTNTPEDIWRAGDEFLQLGDHFVNPSKPLTEEWVLFELEFDLGLPLDKYMEWVNYDEEKEKD